jgi:peptide/nickel transport system substrate-binding protein
MNMARALFAAVASVGLLLSAGGGQAATPRDALVMAWNLDALITFDPAQIGEVNGADIIIGNVCSTLVEYDPKDVTKIVPGTAESWSSSPDGLTLTFKLRSDLKFPDGTPATAEDAAWSLQRAVLLGYFSSANLTQWGFNKDQIADQIQAPDATTLVLKLSKPYPAPLLLSAAFAHNNVATILSKAAGLKNAKTVDGKSDLGNGFFKTAPVCVGPYHVTRWDANDVVILERNDNYFGPKPGLRRIIIRHVPESSAQRLLLQKGDIDVARLLNTDDLKVLESNKDIHIEQTSQHGTTYLAMNTNDPILGNPKVREAIRYLIDYDGLTNTILPYKGVPRADLVPEGAFGALNRKEGQPFSLDLAKAKQLLTEAGYPDGFSKKLILSANDIFPAIAQHVATNAAKVGIKLELEQMADANLFTRGRNRDFEVQLVAWNAGYPDADAMISRHATNPDPRPEAKLVGYPVWRTGWQSTDINAKAEAARLEQDPKKRADMYRDIQQYMMHNGPMAYIFQAIRPIAVRTSVKDFVMSPFFVNYGSASK